VRISVDDFDRPSLYYLKHLPLDSVKIDQSFVRRHLRLKDVAIVTSVIGLACT